MTTSVRTVEVLIHIVNSMTQFLVIIRFVSSCHWEQQTPTGHLYTRLRAVGAILIVRRRVMQAVCFPLAMVTRVCWTGTYATVWCTTK